MTHPGPIIILHHLDCHDRPQEGHVIQSGPPGSFPETLLAGAGRKSLHDLYGCQLEGLEIQAPEEIPLAVGKNKTTNIGYFQQILQAWAPRSTCQQAGGGSWWVKAPASPARTGSSCGRSGGFSEGLCQKALVAYNPLRPVPVVTLTSLFHCPPCPYLGFPEIPSE